MCTDQNAVLLCHPIESSQLIYICWAMRWLGLDCLHALFLCHRTGTGNEHISPLHILFPDTSHSRWWWVIYGPSLIGQHWNVSCLDHHCSIWAQARSLFWLNTNIHSAGWWIAGSVQSCGDQRNVDNNNFNGKLMSIEYILPKLLLWAYEN